MKCAHILEYLVCNKKTQKDTKSWLINFTGRHDLEDIQIIRG